MPKTSANLKRRLPKRRIKVLYVCPFAHYTGHFSWAAVHETAALAQAGIGVELLTFSGITDEAEIKVPHSTACSQTRLGYSTDRFAKVLKKWRLTAWFSMFLETFLTLTVAIRLKQKRNYDVIHLRDGEPFLFLIHLLNLSRRDYYWVVSLTGSNLITLDSYPSVISAFRKGFRAFLYLIYIRILTTNLWRPVYSKSLAKNHFLFLTQNTIIKEKFESYMGGILSGKVMCLALGVNEIDRVISKEEARKYFGLPQDKPVLLSFGFLHAGKDIEVMFRALKDIPDVFLLHGGDQMFRLHLLGSVGLVEKYDMRDRTVIKDCYIPEDEKPYYFFAADAIILSYNKQFVATTSLLWQACRFSLPVIASDNGQLKELVETFQPGLVFKAEDTDSLRCAILRFLNLEPEEVSKLKDNCQLFAGEFSLKNWAKQCIEIYEKLLNKGDSKP